MFSLEPSILEQTIDVNLKGTFYSCQAAARQMVKQGHGGSIIGVSSISALQGGRFQTHYTPTKAGILSLMQSMAIALGEHKIRCNALMPGTVRSQLSADEIGRKESRDRLVAKIPIGRPGEPQDMAGPAIFLASEQMSGFMTGAGLLVDGGMYAYLQ
jgi:NAD(P)-dependent dehydrogenase (short-subunit alcohol dehydrogenase family)